MSCVWADSWELPTPHTYLSSDKSWRFTVTPRPIVSQLAYFEDQISHRARPGARPGNVQKQAQGYLEHRDHGRWRAVWNAPLVNDVAPASAIVSSAGRVVTFDNWGSMGYGDDAIVIYDVRGKPMRALGLEDFLPKTYIEALPTSVSSIWWGGVHHFSEDGRRLLLSVVVPTMGQGIASDDAQHVELPFDMASGKALPPDPQAWARALRSAREVAAGLRASRARWEAAFLAPLRAPNSDEDKDWSGYLVEAFFRLDPGWEDDYPGTTVLRVPQRKDYQASVGFLREALHDEASQTGVLMFASPSQDNLVHVLGREAATVPRGWLKNARVYVVVDDAHTAAVAKALASTGATYIQIDPGTPIPQRKARLDAYMKNKGSRNN
ncbi:hypothetical protein ACFWZ4_15900 [Frateuria sp. GZRe12]|uniref:hypothetical protein n=1 Tax=Frateuria sp. GZRe12 TaxID=3351533 RepID=UPI003EDBEAFE